MADTDQSVDTGVDEPVEVEWVRIYTGNGLGPGLLEEDLKSRGIPAVRMPFEEAGAATETAIFGQEGTTFTIAVPAGEYASRRPEVDEAVAAVAGGLAGDPAAMAEAEEDYDVRGCPACDLYFHHQFTTCPGCGSELLPAVECFEEGQLEPEYVVLRHGPEAELQASGAGLEAAEFHPRIRLLPGEAGALLELPWSELTDRTGEAERLAGGSGVAAAPQP
jgi:hypothetical protein